MEQTINELIDIIKQYEDTKVKDALPQMILELAQRPHLIHGIKSIMSDPTKKESLIQMVVSFVKMNISSYDYEGKSSRRSRKRTTTKEVHY
jgi:hypothetical protein